MAAISRPAAFAVFAVSLSVFSTCAFAQDYPSRSVKIIVPFGAGGPADIFAPDRAQYLSENSSNRFVVENRPGAGSVTRTDAVAKSPPMVHAACDVEHAHDQRVADPQQAVQ